MKGLLEVFKSKSFTSLLGNGVSALLGMLSFSILARFTNKQEFGTWVLFLATYGIFDTLRTGLVLNAFIKNYTQAKSPEEEKTIVGSSLQLSFLVTLIYSVVIGVIYLFFYLFNVLNEYHYFFMWYLLIGIFSMPFNFATWYLNARMQILQMSIVRIVNQILFVVLILPMLLLFTEQRIFYVLIAYTIAQVLTTVFCIIKGWTGFNYYVHRTHKSLTGLFHFGKFSMGTLIGSNLIKNSDSFLIGKFMNSVAVATYSVPSKVVEVFELVIRSFAITNMPLLSALHAKNDIPLLRKEFERKTGFLFLLLLPAALFCFVFAEQIVVLLAGVQYKDAAIILRLFAVYTALTPIDKLSGVMLDIIDKPQLNFIKVILMLSVNVIGDIVCLKVFGTLESVAIVSTLTFATGVLYGMVLLKKQIDVSFTNLFVLGYEEMQNKFNQITQSKK
ncbi:MAG: oligosaccharide flippase family protein [Bacteroidota bacterium]